MTYIFTTAPDTPENREILTAWLALLNFDAFEEDDSALYAYTTAVIDETELQEIIRNAQFKVEYRSEQPPNINWNEQWEKNYFTPVAIGNSLVIRAPFHTHFPKARHELVIEPNMAFGTGHHETTLLMAELLLMLDLRDKNVLDMGCGTGILGMLASRLGASNITAIDNDERAVKSATENARLNNIHNMHVVQGDASMLPKQRRFDLIIANIQKNVIIADLPAYAACLTQEGLILVSGFYADDLPDVIARATQLSLQKELHIEQNHWIACKLSS
ncbi:MAG: 50S ribosomal protein L11 methyltransferase [Bacteroidales bacterium]|jgi:ribosomal protein L11 methyltransferase|nr:50S ribosomal protein L11 methyltransferase [Bacteroidales bacterium]